MSTFIVPSCLSASGKVGLKGVGLRGSAGILYDMQSRFAYGAQIDLGELSPQFRLLVTYERIPELRREGLGYSSDRISEHIFNIDVLNFGRGDWRAPNFFIGLGLSFQIVRERKHVYKGEWVKDWETSHNLVPNFIFGWHLPFQNHFAWNLEVRTNLIGYFEHGIFDGPMSVLRVHLGFMVYVP